MPLTDITIDTNVFLHAANEVEERMEDALAFLSAFLSGDVKLCMDEGFDLDEAKNRSKIWHEYREHFVPGDIGTAIVTKVAQDDRISFVTARVERGAGQKIDQHVSDKRDRTFLKVALNSNSKVLVSHDYVDLTSKVRKMMRKDFAVFVEPADVAATRL